MSSLTKEQLENASADAATLEAFINNSDTPGLMVSRLGRSLKTLAKINTDAAADLALIYADVIAARNGVQQSGKLKNFNRKMKANELCNIAFIGDSTTYAATRMLGTDLPGITSVHKGWFGIIHARPGEGFYNCNAINYGENGATLGVYNADGVTFGLTRTKKAASQIYFPAVNPANGTTITLNGTTITFVTGIATGNQVQIAGSLAATIAALVTFLNASADAQILKCTYTKYDTFSPDTGSTLDIANDTVGTAGEGFTVATNVANAIINNATTKLPDLLVLCYGINDVRANGLGTGTTAVAALKALLVTAVNSLRTDMPNTDIVLWGPNAFLADDPTSAGTVSPLANAQAYSDVMYTAYAELTDYWSNVLVIQKQDVLGKTCQLAAVAGPTNANGWMLDILHPAGNGQINVMDDLAAKIGYYVPFNKDQAAMARLASSTLPYTFYNRECEDPDYYTLIASAYWLDSGSTYMRFAWPLSAAKDIQSGDILQCGPGQSALYRLPAGVATSTYNDGTAIPKTQISGITLTADQYKAVGRIRVYRPKYSYDVQIEKYLRDVATYPYRRKVSVSGGSGFVRFTQFNNAEPSFASYRLDANDVFVFEGLGPLLGSDFSSPNWGLGADILQLSKAATDFTAYTRGYIFGTQADRLRRETSFSPIKLNVDGALSATTYRQAIARGGIVSLINAALATASTVGSCTVAISVNGTLALTLTFAVNVTTQTPTWAAGTSFVVHKGDFISFVVSPGTGSAGLQLSLDAQ